jgi:hypothetical protein
MIFFPENLRNPARNRRAGLMRQFRSGQLYSTKNSSTAQIARRGRIGNARSSTFHIFDALPR